MSNILGKVSCIATIVARTFVAQAADPNTVTIAAVAGVYQGLKYKGSIKNGLKASLATFVVFGTANAVVNVVTNWELVKKS